MPEEGTKLRVNLGFPELVEVPQELQHVRAAAPCKREWGPVVAEVLPERVPVAALLVLVAAQGGGARRRRGTWR